MNLEGLQQTIKEALLARLPESAPGFDPVLSRPPSSEMGDLAVAAFPLAKALGRPPQEVAMRWAERLPAGSDLGAGLTLERAHATGGFLNLKVETPSLLRAVARAVCGEDAGRLSVGRGVRVMVEYSSPNTNKPLHLGHLRNNAIGMSLANLLDATGHEVIRANLVNDRGIHICKSMLAYQEFGGGETPESCKEKGDHFVGRYYIRFDQALREERAAFHAREGIDPAKLDREERDAAEERFLGVSSWMARAQDLLRRWEAGDADVLALWKRMNGWVLEGFRQTYERLGCRFDRWYSESETWMLGKSQVERGLALGVFYKKDDGSVWARLSEQGLKDKILLRADGTSVYITQDIGTAKLKHDDYRMDRSLYVVGQEQVLHFKNLFAILRLLDFPWAAGCHHVAYGLVNLPRGMGRLKSREGTAVDADQLLDILHEEARRRIVDGGYCGEDADLIERTAEAIGQGALKVYLLQVGNDKNIVFDPEERLSFEGDTGPAIQYSHARIGGILRKALERGVVAPGQLLPEGAGATERHGAVPAGTEPRATPPAATGLARGLHEEWVDYSRLGASEERDLGLMLLDYPNILAAGLRQLSAAPLANYLLDLTRAYARFYHAHRVLDAPDPETMRARLHLSLCVAQVLRWGLSILTVEAPERM